MEKKILFELKALYRDNMRINGYSFGGGKKSAVIVGGMRGNEIQQIYCCSQLVERLRELESDGKLCKDHTILVVPCVNPYSVNIEKRFWSTDNTDINRMFPGYDLGETTQRIAAGVFECIQGYEYGVHFTSNYLPGKFVNHVRIMKTGWEDIEKAKAFGLDYISLRTTRPYDTTTLNYNWQVWNTKAYSLLTGETDAIDKKSAADAVSATLRFLDGIGAIEYEQFTNTKSLVIEEDELVSVKSDAAGIFEPLADLGERVAVGEPIARILNACDGSLKQEIKSPVSGDIFFIQSNPLAYSHSVLARIYKKETA